MSIDAPGPPPVRDRREERLALGIVFGALGAAALASMFVALSPTMKVKKAEAPPPPMVHKADLATDVQAAVASAHAAAARADAVAAEAEALAERVRRAPRGSAFARLTLADGRTFEGDATAGVPEGYGVIRGGPVAFGVGFFVGGVRSGPGLDCARADCAGESYAGDFRANAPTGAARVRFGDGAVYRGDVRDGAPDGFGELTRPDGSRYAGAFTRGRRDGHGAETGADGVVRGGFWAGDQLSEPLPS